jgi:myo-inositol-1(or 4)-monophosphatase
MANPTSNAGAEIDLNLLRDHLVAIALEAGQMITSAKPSTTSAATGTKKNTADLVTETDQAVEAFISSKLKGLYPSFSFLGEETYQPGMKLGPEPTFVVDPIDGTTNFVHRWPYVSVSLGFALNRVPTVGVVYNPFTRRLYSGIRGQGSFVRDVGPAAAGTSGESQQQKLPLKELEPLEGLDGSLIAIEWGSDRSGANWAAKCNTWARLGRSKDEGGAMVHSARALGSAALNLCAVAEGSIDAYWEGGCWAWDVCAGWVILTEAGGVVVDGNPGTWDIPIDHRKYLAVKAASEGQREFVEEFWSHIEGVMVYEH